MTALANDHAKWLAVVLNLTTLMSRELINYYCVENILMQKEVRRRRTILHNVELPD